jgi:hypothetical protein
LYSEGALNQSSIFALIKNPQNERIRSIHATFYGGYALSCKNLKQSLTIDNNNLFTFNRSTNSELQLLRANVTEFIPGGYIYCYKRKLKSVYLYILEQGDYYLQQVATYDDTNTPSKLEIPNERIMVVKLGWWAVYVRTESNKIFKTGYGGEYTEIQLHASIGRIKDFFVHIGELYVTSDDNRLFAIGLTQSYTSYHSFNGDYPVMTEMDISAQTCLLPGGTVEIVPRYDGGYMIISQKFNPLDVYRMVKKEKFIDLEIIHL